MFAIPSLAHLGPFQESMIKLLFAETLHHRCLIGSLKSQRQTWNISQGVIPQRV